MPKLLKTTYLAEGEALLRETRATRLFYFPGPVFGLIVFALLDWGAVAGRYGWPGIPVYSSLVARIPASGLDPQLIVIGLLGFITFLTLLWFVARYLHYVSRVYAITSNRVIVQRGIIGRDFEEIPLNQIRGVDVRQTGWQRLLRYGSVYLSADRGHMVSEGVDPIGNEEWKGIPKPFEFQRMVEAATQSLIRGQTGAGPYPPSR